MINRQSARKGKVYSEWDVLSCEIRCGLPINMDNRRSCSEQELSVLKRGERSIFGAQEGKRADHARGDMAPGDA